MSTFRSHRVRCACGAEQDVDLVDGIHATRLPHARQQILDGTFQRFTCPSCRRATVVEKAAIYTDFARNEYVAVETRLHDAWPLVRARHERLFDDAFRSGPAIAAEMGVRFRKRAVIGFQSLREKLLLWDAGLDDLVVEAVKGDLLDAEGVELDEVVLRTTALLDGGHLLFACYPSAATDEQLGSPAAQEGGSRSVELRTALADRYVDRLHARASIAADFPWLADEWLVDLHDGLELVGAS